MISIKIHFLSSSPIDKVGVYVPGGTASYPSSVLMNCIPALIAGVKEIYMTTTILIKNSIQQFYMQLKNVK